MTEDQAKEALTHLVENTYTLVLWPESQDYMEQWWFWEESILANEPKYGSSAYLIPTKYILL